MSVRDRGATALALWRPAPQARHLRRKAAFVDEDQAFGIKVGLALEPRLARRLHIGALLLAGVGSLFLCVCSCRSRNFQTAVLDHRDGALFPQSLDHLVERRVGRLCEQRRE